MNSPLDAIPYDLDPEDEIIDTQPWWGGDQSSTQPNPPSSRRDSSPSIDPMDTSTSSSQRGLSVPPISIPESTANRRPSTTASVGGSETMAVSPIQTIMPPPMVPQLARMKRKGISLLSNFVDVD